MSRVVGALSGLVALAIFAILPSVAAAAEVGPSGLPLPRFVSLKASRVNVRLGPGDDYPIAWIYTKPGLPVEVLQEFDTWRRIRDSEGAVGWVFEGLLTGKRTALVAPWKASDPLPARASPSADAPVAALLQPGVLSPVKSCKAGWCRLKDPRFDAWIEAERLWGVYPDEKID
ncbi:MAG: SH3 domain-containing protein [Bauldia sp.]